MSHAALEVISLEKRYPGGRGVQDVSFIAPSGLVTGFLGVNGAGKSTTLRCVAGLLRPDCGVIRILGETGVAAARRLTGFLPEERGLCPHERAVDAVVFHGRLRGMRGRDAKREAERLLERLGLGTRARDRVSSLSKGNAQRVQIACAMVHGPGLLLMDEPLSGLDPVAQADILSLLSEFRAAGGAVVFSTHAMASAERVCDRLVMIAGGRTVFEGPTSTVASGGGRWVCVETPDAGGLLRAAAALAASVAPVDPDRPDAQTWRVALPDGVTHPTLLRALQSEGVPISRFQPLEPGLENAFWSLAVSRTEAERSFDRERQVA